MVYTDALLLVRFPVRDQLAVVYTDTLLLVRFRVRVVVNGPSFFFRVLLKFHNAHQMRRVLLSSFMRLHRT